MRQPIVPGRRAQAAHFVIGKASDMVAARVTLDAVEQSFPDFNETPEDKQFLRALSERAVEMIKTNFDVCCLRVCTKAILNTDA